MILNEFLNLSRSKTFIGISTPTLDSFNTVVVSFADVSGKKVLVARGKLLETLKDRILPEPFRWKGKVLTKSKK